MKKKIKNKGKPDKNEWKSKKIGQKSSDGKKFNKKKTMNKDDMKSGKFKKR